MIHLPTLKSQAVRDLAWVCFSPSLIDHLPNSDASIYTPSSALETHQLMAWLIAIDKNPEPLLNHLSQRRSPRLGIYYEALCAYVWQYYPSLQLHKKNIQVNRNNKTFGEFDLITESPAGIHHSEVAVKFYLGLPKNNNGNLSESQWCEWLGPNCNDRLDKKLFRLRDHQLPLSTTEEGQAALHPLMTNNGKITRALQLQGYLFYPAHQTMPTPSHCNPKHLRGQWYYYNDFINNINENSDWLVLDKQYWLSPAVTDNDSPPSDLANTKAKLKQYFLTNQPAFDGSSVSNQHSATPQKIRPLLLAKMTRDKQQWHETSRCFIVADHWPWNKPE